MRKSFQPRLFALLVCAATAGCASTRVENATPASALSLRQRLPEPSYKIMAGDELEIRFFYTPELNVEMPVRPDGMIGLPFAQGIQAAGKTPEELALELQARYALELEDPEIAVIVRSFLSRKIHVGGHVGDPGVFDLSGPMTIVDSLFEAGGLLPGALLEQVLVIRPEPGLGYQVIACDLDRVFDGTDLSQNIALLPHDAVFVPKSRIANVNEWVDLYIRKNIPVSVGIRPWL